MASLVEELVNILEAEQKVYEKLTGYEEKKKDVLIRADVPALEEITNLEQLAGDELIAYSNKQVQALTDIATVLGKTEEKMTVTRLIDLLDTQPEIQKKLTIARDTLFKSLRQAPETANYDKSAYNTGSLLGGGGFDATS